MLLFNEMILLCAPLSIICCVKFAPGDVSPFIISSLQCVAIIQAKLDAMTVAEQQNISGIMCIELDRRASPRASVTPLSSSASEYCAAHLTPNELSSQGRKEKDAHAHPSDNISESPYQSSQDQHLHGESTSPTTLKVRESMAVVQKFGRGRN